jgi:hypothetical protein
MVANDIRQLFTPKNRSVESVYGLNLKTSPRLKTPERRVMNLLSERVWFFLPPNYKFIWIYRSRYDKTKVCLGSEGNA